MTDPNMTETLADLREQLRAAGADPGRRDGVIADAMARLFPSAADPERQRRAMIEAALAAPDDAGALAALGLRADPWPAVTAGALLDEEDENLDWLVHELLPAGGTSLLIGTPKSGKSSLARTMASKVVTGRPWLGRQTKTGPVLYVALDERRSTVREHIRALARGCGGDDAATLCERLHVSFGPRPEAPALALAAKIERLDPAPVLVVIDTLMKAFPFEDANDYGLSGDSMAQVMTLAEQTGAHFMLVHHQRKDATDPTTAALGSTRLAADVDVIASLRVDAANERRLASFIGRDGVSAADLDVSFTASDGDPRSSFAD